MEDAEDDAGNDEVEADARTRLMEEVAAQMDAIEEDFGDDYEIGNIITVVEVIRPDESGIRVRSTAPYLVGLGMLHVAENMLDEHA
jgi:hypothetical protein